MHLLPPNWFIWIGISHLFFILLPALSNAMFKTFYPQYRITPQRRKRGRDHLCRGDLFRHLSLHSLNATLLGTCIFLGCFFQSIGVGHLVFWPLNSINDWILIFFQVMFILIVFDTQFYWMHLLVHSFSALYQAIHKEHHAECYPNTWDALHQHPVDLFLTTASPFAWVVLIPLPLHEYSYLIALLSANYTNICGHSGYEITRTLSGIITLNGWAAYIDPKRKWISRAMNTVTHHDLHHQYFQYNYSLYFTFWDFLVKTLAKDSDKVLHLSTPKKKP